MVSCRTVQKRLGLACNSEMCARRTFPTTSKPAALGIDIGGTKTLSLLVDKKRRNVPEVNKVLKVRQASLGGQAVALGAADGAFK